MKYAKITFKEIFHELKRDKNSFEGGYLYLPKGFDEDIKLDTKLYFAEPPYINESDDGDEEIVPKEVLEEGFEYGYLSDYLLDVFEVLSSEKPKFTDKDFLKAFNYYLENDTFIPIENL